MQIYLPIAEMAIDPFLLLALGLGVGLLSGMFGVGGAFILTPTLIFIGLPPAVAVASQANVVLASSVSGALFHWRRGNIDWLMGGVLLVGGVAGAGLGVLLFGLLRGVGQLEATLALSYVVLLFVVGALMVVEGLRQFSRRGRRRLRRHHIHTWAHGLPFKLRFRRSQIYASALLPFAVGLGVGVLSAFLGVGGGFVLVPLMIYLLGMPTGVVVGTSLFQMIFVAASASFFHATSNHSVDLVLAAILVVGSVLGAQYGGRLGARLPVHTLRLLLGALLFALGMRLFFSLTLPPADFYVLG
ncbi:MAG: sulfite exporter TauE/SafE family protein [Alphaproteobacteria bacterium]|nr:sulfite exporter TauE/SafE family protein [Alphaproteobacteria bacterium]MDA7982588.1 sulfite exporter TauE/SafE family protein [Alphaproteobacteria bacterium]MDA7984058.1 sulfite exporter TauE/SafE family protein [Alphaproteobacteria bacterium]MDA7986940.1 sulfite exporter TauE/SafE family protein [Alphaproteobacteria bacterium]MDA7988295.1 sulfite exporter TauE/SafE family protein [Alphaproteobacteria bacterium]